MPGRPKKVEKLCRNKAKPTTATPSSAINTSALGVGPKRWSRSSASVNVTSCESRSYSASSRINCAMMEMSSTRPRRTMTANLPQHSASTLPTPLQPAEENLVHFLHQLRFRHLPIWAKPLVDPQHHTEKGKCRDFRVDLPNTLRADRLGERGFQESHVALLARVDLCPRLPVQRGVLVQDDDHFLGPAVRHQQDVLFHAALQPLQRIGDRHHLIEHLFLEDVHAVVHDLHQKVLLAANVMIEPRLGQTGGLRDVVDRGPFVAFFADDLCGRLEDLLPPDAAVVRLVLRWHL